MTSEFQIKTIIDSLEVKLRRVIMAYTDLKEELKQVKKEKEELKNRADELYKNNIALQKELDEHKKNFKKSDNFAKIVANNLKSTGNTAEFKEKLDGYILEIDKCISQLSH